jgi:polysaccharide export outer membrane protein
MRSSLILYSALAISTFCLQALSQDKAKTAQPQKQTTQAQAQTTQPQQLAARVNTTRPAGEASADYIIGPEDVLGVSVWREPELTAKVAVRPDGKIDLPLVNDIKASGLTTNQLREVITESIKRYVPDPTVSVLLLELHSQTVSIVGSVPKPGIYNIGGPMTVMELVARAGGFQEFAKVKDVQIVRQVGARAYRYFFNYKEYTEGRNFQQNIALQNGDVVVVP